MHGSIFTCVEEWCCSVPYLHSHIGYICIQFGNSSKLQLKDPYQFATTIHHCNFSPESILCTKLFFSCNNSGKWRWAPRQFWITACSWSTNLILVDRCILLRGVCCGLSHHDALAIPHSPVFLQSLTWGGEGILKYVHQNSLQPKYDREPIDGKWPQVTFKVKLWLNCLRGPCVLLCNFSLNSPSAA